MSKRFTLKKGSFTNRCNIIMKSYGLKLQTAVKHKIGYLCNTGRNCKLLYVTSVKCRLTYKGDTIMQFYSFQITYFVSKIRLATPLLGRIITAKCRIIFTKTYHLLYIHSKPFSQYVKKQSIYYQLLKTINFYLVKGYTIYIDTILYLCKKFTL